MEYSEACSDAWYLITSLKYEELLKIPSKFLETISILKNDNYESKIDLNIPLENQELSEATIGLISFIYNNYLGTKEEKEEYKKSYAENINLIKDNDIFEFKWERGRKHKQEETKIVLYENKTNIFLRFLNRIKKIFSR